MPFDAVSLQARQMVHDYDHNRNGVIDLTCPQGEDPWTFRDETLRFTHFDRGRLNQISNPLFFAADADGKPDNRVTAAEVEASLRRFDANGSGAIDRITTDRAGVGKAWSRGLLAAAGTGLATLALFRLKAGQAGLVGERLTGALLSGVLIGGIGGAIAGSTVKVAPSELENLSRHFAERSRVIQAHERPAAFIVYDPPRPDPQVQQQAQRQSQTQEQGQDQQVNVTVINNLPGSQAK